MRHWLWYLSICLSCGLLPVSVIAQSAAPPAVTITQAVQEALDHNLTLFAERYNVSVAEARIITARLRPNPVLTLSAALPDHTIFRSATTPYAEVGHLEWVFERGGKRAARIAVAEQARTVTQLQLLDTIRTLTLEVENACVDVLVAKANLALGQENLQALNSIVQINTHRVRTGDLAPVELQRSSLAALQFQNDVRKSESELLIARNKLRTLLGRPFGAGLIDVDGELRRDGAPASAETVRLQAFTLRPDLQALVRDEARSAAELRLQIAQGKIDFTIGGEFQRQQAPTLSGNQYGISFSVPLPLFNRNQGEIARAVREREQLLAKIRALEHDITGEAQNAYQTYLTAHQIVENIEQHMLEQAQNVRTVMEYSYRKGQARFVEFLDAQRAYNDTRQSYNQVRADYARSLYQLDAVSGASVNPTAAGAQ